MNALEELKKFAETCNIPNVGGVKSGWGRLALANTPMLKFKSEHYASVKAALASTLEKNPELMVFFRGISLADSLRGRPPSGKYFTVCVECKNPRKLGQMCIANYASTGI